MNVVAIMGRLTADPEVRQTPNGINVCSFTLAVDRYTNGERKADFINCVAWRETADNIARFFRKGVKIAVNGSIQTRTYQDKETGKNRTAFEVLVDRFHFCEKSEQAQSTGYTQPATFGQQPQYGAPRMNIDINPPAPQMQTFAPQQQGFIPAPQPRFQPVQIQPAAPQYPAGFEPLASDRGDLPF